MPQSNTMACHPCKLPPERVRSYDRPAPRYTSYPTAPTWEPLESGAARQALESIGRESEPISVYVHIPFCRSMCRYCGCNVLVARTPKRVEPYLAALAEEIALVRSILGPRAMAQLHLGGGTPTFLSPGQLDELCKALFCAFLPTAEAELSVEIDPMVTTREQLQILHGHGFNRLSMGVQDFNEEVQQRIGRGQTRQVTHAMYEMSRSVGFESISMDLIVGLPGQTPELMAACVTEVASLGADRVAAFLYAHVPWIKPHQRRLEAFGLPDWQQRWQMFQAVRSGLLQAGYVPLGLDHFAKASDELARAFSQRRLHRNFQGYTALRPTHLVGLGLSSISDVGGVYLQNHKHLNAYLSAIRAGRFATERGRVLSREDKLRRSVILDIMCNLQICFAPIEQRFGIDFADHFASELRGLQPFAADGLVEQHRDAIVLTEQARPFLRNIAALFDAYLGQREADQPSFSRTV